MNIGIIIFVISVIISIITTMRENSHKDRQNQKPPQKTPEDKQPKKGGFFEQIERTFKEISDELNDEEDKKKSKRKIDDTLPPLFDNESTKERKVFTESSKPSPEYQSTMTQSKPSHKDIRNNPRQSMTRDENSEEIKRQLEQSLKDDIKMIRSDIDKEKEKQIALMEKRARNIIEDKYLSERTKRIKLKQLLNSQNVEKNMTHSAFQFDSDEIINGMIWSEVLNKPKRL
ncbi:iron transporter [Staphylococcus simiae]|uniref:iron transporter n=1 Tax=Staphylococcus simiae TaxID=308354 RepID=UPI001A96FC1C|nr:iron transporter [Staphylococcus simiae]MBO1197968.1 iron transporter [Staphylococcus simiae]MBO1200445.1 iron transporter [Staphylococcus simiae]MBO1202718.1 iron transporter [Staphylococcus simiae]MBO1209959.1 iron transporter [Staphylococcus simiae]MBO1228862.1 iron transporter [Staphylococcus simiae]